MHVKDYDYKHLVVSIEYWKRDAAILTCSCGFKEGIGLWHITRERVGTGNSGRM